MPVRLPRARAAEGVAYGVAGLGAFAPFYLLLPGAEERVAARTARWAPRWERSMSYLASPARSVAQRVEPRLGKAVRRIDAKLPLEKMALALDRRIKLGLDRFGRRN